MSIKDRQIAIATHRVLEEELKAGRYPNLSVIQQKVMGKFQKRPVGLPRLTVERAEQDQLSNPTAFNTMMNQVAEDLHTGFIEMGHQTDRVMAIANVYDTERNNINLSLRQIENRIETLMEKLDTRSHRHVIFDTFNTFNLVDFKGNEARGIPRTNVFVDLRHGQAILKSISAGGTRHDISNANASVRMTKGTGKGQEIMPINNAMRDTINEAWQYTVVSAKAEVTEVTILIELQEDVSITSLALDLQSPKETEITLSVSQDNELFQELKTYKAHTFQEWKLNHDVKYIRLEMRKYEPDTIHGTDFEYHFGIANIGIKKEGYIDKGYLVSTPHLIEDKVVDRVFLKAKETVQTGTNIRYYIGIDNEIDLIEWQEIEPGQTFNLNRLTHDVLNIDATATGYGVIFDHQFGLDYYKIVDLLNKPESLSSRIYMGDYMWQTDIKTVTLDAAYIPSLQDWTNLKGVQTSFIPIEQTTGTNTYAVRAGTLQRLTTMVYCEEPAEILNHIFAAGAEVNFQVYVNNTLLKPVIDTSGVRRYSYSFKKGWNQIQILTYTAVSTFIQPNLVLTDIASRIYASDVPLKEVSLYDLINNTSKTNLHCFAIHGQSVIINYSPKALDQTGVGIRYAMEYDYVPIDTTRDTKLRFMAILSRSELEDQITPILENYQLIIE